MWLIWVKYVALAVSHDHLYLDTVRHVIIVYPYLTTTVHISATVLANVTIGKFPQLPILILTQPSLFPSHSLS